MSSDTAFFDRVHFYLPGWEVPKFSPKHFTDSYGFISDYLAEFFRTMRKYNFSDAFDKYFKLGNNINQRDTMAIRKTVSALVKLLYPNGEYTKEDIEEILIYALEGRRRVKEQLKRIGGMEFYAINFSYIDNETFEEKFVGVPERGTGKIIPEGQGKAGTVYTIARSETGVFGTYRIETELVSGNGKLSITGLNSSTKAKEGVNTAFNYLKANRQYISGNINIINNDFLVDVRDIQGVGNTHELSLAALVALTSASMKMPVQSQLAVLGTMSIGGTINKLEELANMLQVASEAGATKVLLPSSAKVQIGDVPDDLFTKFQIIFYKDPEEAVFKALSID
jgi:ATP-dependent Lon protease